MTLRPLLPPALLLLVLGPALAVSVREALVARRGLPAGPARRRTAAQWWLRAAAVLAAAGIGLGPSLPSTRTQSVGSTVDVFFVVDRTGSMAAQDWDGARPRLDGVRHDLPALVEALPGARYSVIAWDSEATRQLPLTSDTRALESWAQTVRQEVTAYSAGSLVDRPLPALTAALQDAAELRPAHARLVFFLSDGEQTAPGSRRSYAALDALVDGGAVLGYGTTEGGVMRRYDGTLEPDPEAPLIVDPDAPPGPDGAPAPAVSRIDESALRAVADELGVPYVHRTGPDPVEPLTAGLDPGRLAADGVRAGTVWTAVVWPFALVLAGLLACEVAGTIRAWQPVRRGPRTSGAVDAA